MGNLRSINNSPSSRRMAATGKASQGQWQPAGKSNVAGRYRSLRDQRDIANISAWAHLPTVHHITLFLDGGEIKG